MTKEKLEDKANAYMGEAEKNKKSLCICSAKYLTLPLLVASGITSLALPEYRDIAGYTALASLAPPLFFGLYGLIEVFNEISDSMWDIDEGF